jgi:ArsR family transcriptional regulator
MDQQAKHRLEKRAAVLKALGHPARLLLMEALREGEHCVCELHELAGGDFSTVSKHLAQLRQAGLLEMEKRGLKVFYRLRNRHALRLLECADQTVQAMGKEALQ